MAVISSDVVLAGQPWRQNVCRVGIALRESTVSGLIADSRAIGVAITESFATGMAIESSTIQATWRLCVKPAPGAA